MNPFWRPLHRSKSGSCFTLTGRALVVPWTLYAHWVLQWQQGTTRVSGFTWWPPPSGRSRAQPSTRPWSSKKKTFRNLPGREASIASFHHVFWGSILITITIIVLWPPSTRHYINSIPYNNVSHVTILGLDTKSTSPLDRAQKSPKIMIVLVCCLLVWCLCYCWFVWTLYIEHEVGVMGANGMGVFPDAMVFRLLVQIWNKMIYVQI